jgi:hypothetical protein
MKRQNKLEHFFLAILSTLVLNVRAVLEPTIRVEFCNGLYSGRLQPCSLILDYVEAAFIGKPSSLLRQEINYGGKSFYLTLLYFLTKRQNKLEHMFLSILSTLV